MSGQDDKRVPGHQPGRRKFLVEMAATACGVGLLGMGIGLYSRQARSLPATAIRPPGALPEDEFQARCIRCGLCVRDCPYDILRLATPGEEVATGTPYFIARTDPCEMCEDIPCVPACPTGALDHDLTDIRDARMGLAVLVDQESCLAFQGLRCEVCFNVCPIRGEAITLDRQHNPRSGRHALFIPVVHSDACTGCGLCERACILDEAAIRVLPRSLAKGKVGEHYRFGWKEKEAAGGSLVTPDPEHHYSLPPGVEYEHGGRGLILDDETSSAGVRQSSEPFPADPLETLKRGIEEAR